MIPHKHAHLIKAWAEGAKIEYKQPNNTWVELPTPYWDTTAEYRIKPTEPKFKLGDYVWKKSGSQWAGHVVGTYSTKLTPEGYAVESIQHQGSVQIYPAAALIKEEETYYE